MLLDLSDNTLPDRPAAISESVWADDAAGGRRSVGAQATTVIAAAAGAGGALGERSLYIGEVGEAWERALDNYREQVPRARPYY